MTEIRLYFEGDSSLKEGFRSVLGILYLAARGQRCRFQLINTGGTPLEDYRIALKTHPDAWNILLMDSDGPDDGKLFEKLSRSAGFEESREGSVFWMVQVMEAWFFADVEALQRYYGEGFHDRVLRGSPNVEQIPKRDVHQRLRHATRDTRKGPYHKTRHAPHLLRLINPDRVQEAAPNFRKLIATVQSRLRP